MPPAADPDASSDSLSEEHRRLLERFFDGHRGALARAISRVEDESSGFQELLHAVLRERARRREEGGSGGKVCGAGQGIPAGTHRIGVTGPPGAGKSTLVTTLAGRYRDGDETVGIVAVDPTSPFSGGALLGDRIRMRDLTTDPGVFIRSMATRSGSGGLATTTGEVTDLMDAFGFHRILVETVGVGQTELEIAGAADTVVVVLVPESGDMVQAMKAGLMEIADVFVVNKADRSGADSLIRDLRQAIDLRRPGASGSADSAPDWEIPVLRTVASSGEGVEELREAVETHGEWLRESGEGGRRAVGRARSRIRSVVERELRRRVWSEEALGKLVDSGAESVRSGSETPYSVADRILSAVDRTASAVDRIG